MTLEEKAVAKSESRYVQIYSTKITTNFSKFLVIHKILFPKKFLVLQYTDANSLFLSIYIYIYGAIH